MINGLKVLAIIPARGGSKGLPGKNIINLAGKPLIAWTIEVAKQSKFIDKLILSSDDEEIISVAKKYGCDVPFKRPAELALDSTPGIDPILHAMKEFPEFDLVICLQATSPLRNSADIDGAIEMCIMQNSPSCISVSPAEQSPYWMFKLDNQNVMMPLLSLDSTVVRRQDLPPVYTLNGAVYVAKSEWIKKTKSFLSDETTGFIMPVERSIDIDTELDLQIASYILEKEHRA
jgi:CMP-N,N'-diacetyllegionaminic acid synthase